MEIEKDEGSMKNFKGLSGVVISIISILIAIVSLQKSYKSNRISQEANKIANKALEEPIMCIKEFIAIDRERPVDIYGNSRFKKDPSFAITPDKYMKYNIENFFVVVNEGAIAATPFGDTPSTRVKIISKFPVRVFSIGISGVPISNWKWDVSYEQNKEQISYINIYDNFPPQKEFTVTFFYYLKRRQSISDVNQVLSEYFEISVWSPRSLRSQPCQWMGGEILKSPYISEN